MRQRVPGRVGRRSGWGTALPCPYPERRTRVRLMPERETDPGPDRNRAGETEVDALRLPLETELVTPCGAAVRLAPAHTRVQREGRAVGCAVVGEEEATATREVHPVAVTAGA